MERYMTKISLKDIIEIYNLNNEILSCYNFRLINFYKKFDGISLIKNFEIEFDFQNCDKVYTIQEILSFEDSEKEKTIYQKILFHIENLQQDNFFNDLKKFKKEIEIMLTEEQKETLIKLEFPYLYDIEYVKKSINKDSINLKQKNTTGLLNIIKNNLIFNLDKKYLLELLDNYQYLDEKFNNKNLFIIILEENSKLKFETSELLFIFKNYFNSRKIYKETYLYFKDKLNFSSKYKDIMYFLILNFDYE
jgi:hypothetical protein